MSFPVTDLDAYERHMRFRERAGGVGFIWLGSLFLASAAPGRTSVAAAVVAGCIGAAAGLVLWAVRRPGTYLGERAGSRIFDRVDRVGDLTGRAWTRIIIVVVVWTALVFVAGLVLRAFGVSVPLVLIGGAGWVAGGFRWCSPRRWSLGSDASASRET
jgi:hypothetical protein